MVRYEGPRRPVPDLLRFTVYSLRRIGFVQPVEALLAVSKTVVIQAI